MKYVLITSLKSSKKCSKFAVMDRRSYSSSPWRSFAVL